MIKNKNAKLWSNRMQIPQLRVLRQLTFWMGQRWCQEARHLPTRYNIINRKINEGSGNMVYAEFTCSLFIGFVPPSLSDTMVHVLARAGSLQTLATFTVAINLDDSRDLKEIEVLKLNYEPAGVQILVIQSQNSLKNGWSSEFGIVYANRILPNEYGGINGEATLFPSSGRTTELPLSSFWFISRAPGL